MPEEINRVLTDQISDFLFTTEKSANDNLNREGITSDRVHFVGNVMIDTLIRFREEAKKRTMLKELNLTPKNYVLMTFHRPSNVDDPVQLGRLLGVLRETAERLKVVFPIHPRTKKVIEDMEVLIDGLDMTIHDKDVDFWFVQEHRRNRERFFKQKWYEIYAPYIVLAVAGVLMIVMITTTSKQLTLMSANLKGVAQAINQAAQTFREGASNLPGIPV